MKIVTILGNRPQFIKHGLLSKRLRQEHEEIIIHTGQHYDDEMSGVFFRELGLPEPDYDLGIKEPSPHRQIGKMVKEIGDLLDSLYGRPDLVLLHGDTNSTLAGAIASSKLHIPIAHIEAGVRCRDRSIPEEINRILVDQMSDLLFCPTHRSYRTIMDASENDNEAHFTGDVLYDTYLHYSQQVEPIPCEVFVTIHRENNVDNWKNLQQILNAINWLDQTVIFPIHPRLKNKLPDNFLKPYRNPMGYLETIAHIQGAKLVITDSGGVQREAYFAGIPCVYIGTAGWPELKGYTCADAVPTDTGEILEAVERIKYALSGDAPPENIFGDGTAVEFIAEILSKFGISVK